MLSYNYKKRAGRTALPFTCSRMLRYLSRVNGAFLFLDLRFTCPEIGQAPLQLKIISPKIGIFRKVILQMLLVYAIICLGNKVLVEFQSTATRNPR